MDPRRLILSATHYIGHSGGNVETRVTLRPGSKGTKRLVERYGERLICVRYRYDLEKKLRYKTVELIVDEVQWDPSARTPSTPAPGKPPVMVGVRIRYDEELLRRGAKAAGARWDPQGKVWLMTLQVARRLGLEARVVAVPDGAR